MNHSSKYRLIQEGTGKRVPKGKLQPYGVYKISTYKYADGNYICYWNIRKKGICT